MLEQLRFVQGAVGKRDFIPALTHYRIANSIITSYNGTIALSCPIPCNINCVPKAEPFYRAIQGCKSEQITMHMTQAGRLAIKSGNFKVFIECIAEPVTPVQPEGEYSTSFDGERLLRGLSTVLPFVGNDASRPWAMGALVKGTSIFATNNVILVECYTATDFPFLCNIPLPTIKELVRIGRVPVAVQANEFSLTFHYEGDAWLKTQLYSAKWPDVERIVGVNGNMRPVTEELFEGLELLRPFQDSFGRVYLKSYMCPNFSITNVTLIRKIRLVDTCPDRFL